ncbi:glycosyltransferase family 2 protein [Alkalihalobacillus sp. LMS39]|uniref:glycosyltransferase family 2 protein n=1 Tax=Alkalihalobacillus sp. LMS39 TaxID=2924032 RepID=UPI001FB2328C|nr:glycosyltransferase family 2 protein [Alkalihalobacillus sp. LMS39]UOE95943.1 glycosyltransferase family 2 protein [Alkalihalobacillus sp. LMS39]
MMKISVVIPAYNEADIIEETLLTLRKQTWVHEIITVNDGSTDATGEYCAKLSDIAIQREENKGKGEALQTGWEHASGDIIVCLDADLGESVKEAQPLIEPFESDFIDVVIGRLPQQKVSGLGFVKERAKRLIYKRTGHWISAPLSGQRAFRKKWLDTLMKNHYQGYGVETAMLLDLLEAGATVIEVDTFITHRATGKNIAGFLHRGKQWLELEKSVWRGLE